MKAGLLFIALAGVNCYAVERFEFSEPHMGTQVKIVVYANDRPAAAKAVRAAFYRIHELEMVLSDYKTDSEISKLAAKNDAAANVAYPISDDLAKVLQTSLKISQASDGAFDVTLGPLTQLWRGTRKSKVLPESTTMKSALETTGWKKLTLDAKAKTLVLAVPKMRLDFGGIGKGFAADEALKVLQAEGIASALVALSGDVAVSNAPPGEKGWVVEIAPLNPKDPPRKLLLADAAVSTSGDLFQHVEIGGVRYSHVLNPKTGLGLTGYRSATVVAKDGAHADALAKVASILPAAEALKVIAGFDAAAFIASKAMLDEPPMVEKSESFEKRLVK